MVAWPYALISASACCGALKYKSWFAQKASARRAEDREREILRLAALTLSIDTVKAVVADRDVRQDLKRFGIGILTAQDTKNELKVLVKDRFSDPETKGMIKIFMLKHIVRDYWVEEELLRLVHYVIREIHSDTDIYPGKVLSRLGESALLALNSQAFRDHLKREVCAVLIEIVKGYPRYAPVDHWRGPYSQSNLCRWII